MKKSTRVIAAVLLISAMILPRVIALTSFTAADEPFWLAVSANYYYALTHHEFQNTVYEYHPAVTTMWVGTAAMVVYFPQYRALMHGYFQQEKTSFDTYLTAHNRNPLTLLWWARFFQLLLNVSLLLIVFFLLRLLTDEWTALGALLLASFAPYLFGQSRMLNHESMVGLFSLISLLGMTVHLFSDRRHWSLFLSAFAAACANLTKSSALFLFPVIVVILAHSAYLERGPRSALPKLKMLGIWLLELVLVYIILWPGMWVAPGKMLYEVYGNAFSYAFEGSRLSVATSAAAPSFDVVGVAASFLHILILIAWRTTPLTWLGLALATLFLMMKRTESPGRPAKFLIAYLILQALACIGLFAVAHGRDQPHYVLSSYYALEIVSGLGWMIALRQAAQAYPWAQAVARQALLFVALFAAQAYPLLYTAPYYYTYFNPVLLAASAPPEFRYGEEMEQAAAYLAQKPGSANQTALVYFGRSFSYYYPGMTLLFKPVLFDDKAQLVENLRQSDYLVVYTDLQDRLPLLKLITPERVITLNGRPYVEIYRVSDIPASFYGG